MEAGLSQISKNSGLSKFNFKMDFGLFSFINSFISIANNEDFPLRRIPKNLNMPYICSNDLNTFLCRKFECFLPVQCGF